MTRTSNDTTLDKSGTAVVISEGYVTIFRHYPYSIRLDRINTPYKLLGWVERLSRKTWMTTAALSNLVTLVSDHFQWRLPTRVPPKPITPTATEPTPEN